MESKDVSRVDETLLHEVEADVYWCLTKLLDNIQVRGVPGWGGRCACRREVGAAAPFLASRCRRFCCRRFYCFLLFFCCFCCCWCSGVNTVTAA